MVKTMGFEDHFKKLDVKGVMITSIMTALAFVVGLFWRDAIAETINQLVPEGEGLIYKYVAALIATVVVVIIGYILIKAQEIKPEYLLKKKRSSGSLESFECLENPVKDTGLSSPGPGFKSRPEQIHAGVSEPAVGLEWSKEQD